MPMTTPVEFATPSTMTDAMRIKLAQWLETLPPDVAEVARTYPITTCYRSIENPIYHYVISGYDGGAEDGQPITLRLVHGADSTLPGVCAFGQAYQQLVKCDCGQWEPPTEEQTKLTHAALQRQFVKPGDVVQLDPEKCRWGPVFVVVEEVKRWGVIGYFMTHGDDGPGQAPIRVNHGDYARIGHAEWLSADLAEKLSEDDDEGDELPSDEP